MINIKTRKSTALLFVALALLLLCACSPSISGKYVSESGTYSVEFNKNGECTWYQGSSFFYGTYERSDDGEWKLEVEGSGLYSNTVFTAVEDEDGFIITGGTVDGELFTIQ